ncbi:hypothetical protein UFOVP1015_5 [uncultured Caudovirales phage]|uniref:Uncharacterized protein n=1 Tax=uncultured Caudovirales phage TaxID=2100421 RepID=A0A6J5Q0L0_9CAUD|nr:hypothetical protein UFOVP1015_5 [uncultured Caudovirales phage]CAB5229335.1 hypothetical protein UFOVP1551_36 [uncultured Caudovirales phage]
MIFLIPLIAIYFVCYSGINIRFKPFNCEHCLSIWLTVAYTIYNHYPYDEVIIFAGVNALIAVFVNKILNVLNNFIQ